MYALIFRNWKFALLWAIGVSASAAAFMERDGGQAQLQASADQIRAQKDLIAKPVPAASAAPASESAQPEESAENEAEPEEEASESAA